MGKRNVMISVGLATDKRRRAPGNSGSFSGASQAGRLNSQHSTEPRGQPIAGAVMLLPGVASDVLRSDEGTESEEKLH